MPWTKPSHYQPIFRLALRETLKFILQEETQITSTVDPWGGSYFVEKLTHDIAKKAWEPHSKKWKNLGGMTKAIEAGIPKLRIEEAAARKQARIDSGQDIIVGVNQYQLEKEDPLHILDVDNQKVRKEQIEQLQHLKKTRNQQKVNDALTKLTEPARKSGERKFISFSRGSCSVQEQL